MEQLVVVYVLMNDPMKEFVHDQMNGLLLGELTNQLMKQGRSKRCRLQSENGP
jgi:hypothetical protein